MTSPSALDASAFEPVRRLVENAVSNGTHPSAIVSIARLDGTGWTHVAPGQTGDTLHHRFPIASITKPIVALAVLRLVERGDVLLSDPVARHLPEFGVNGKEHVTLWHLLTHTSGLHVPEEVTDALWHERAPKATYLRASCEAPLLFEPGTRHAYVGVHAFEVLAEIVSRLRGRDFTAVLQDEVFAPLGMNDTSFDIPDPTRLAHAEPPKSPDELAYWASLTFASGGLLTTVADLRALGLALLAGGRAGASRLLSSETLSVMTRLHTRGLPGENGPAFAALGWGKRSDAGVLLASEASYGHSGSTGAFLWVDPTHDLVFVFLSSEGGPEPHRTPMLALNAALACLSS